MVTPRYMHEVEPLLYWRVKIDGKWKFERARYVIIRPYAGLNNRHKTSTLIIEVEIPEVTESE